MTNSDDRLLQEAWERYRSAPSDESLAEFNRLWETAMQRAEQQDSLIAEHAIWKVIPLAGPALRRLREKPPAGFPHPVKSDAGVRYYSAKQLQGWAELRIAKAIRIIEPDLQAPPSLSPQARIYRNGAWKTTPGTPQEICEAIVEEAMMAMAREAEIFFEERRMDSVDQRDKVEQLRAAMIKAKRALEDLDMPRQLRRELALRDGFTPEAAARVIGRCDERLQKPARRPTPDAFEKEIAAKWARELLKRFGREEKIVSTKGGPCAQLAAILFGDPDEDLSRYCYERA
jgi:hypothetical protein